MADRSGIAAQLGISAESTYGTYVAPTRFLPFVSEALALDIARMKSAGLRSGQRIGRSDGWAPGTRQAAGSVELEVGNKGFGLLFAKALGAAAASADGTGFKRTYTMGDLFGDMLTMQVGRPDVSGTVQPFSYLGCKIAGFSLEQTVDEFLKLSLDVDARDETTAQSLVAATAPALTELFHWGQMAVTVGGSSFAAEEFAVEVDNNLKTDRFKLRGNTLKDEPIEQRRTITGRLVGEFESLTHYNRYTGGTTAAIVATWTSALTYDTGKFFKLEVTLPTCRFDGTSPNVDGDGVLPFEYPFEVLDSGSGQPITIDYYTSDSSD